MAVRILSSQDRSRALVTGLVFLAIGAALFYFGGGDFIRGDSWLPMRGTFHGNGWVLGSEQVAVSVNGSWYGLRLTPRFFDAPFIQIVMVGGAIGATLFFLTMLRNAVFGVEMLDSSDDD